MATPKSHWKLGLFVVVGSVLMLGTAALLGALSMRREVGLYQSYFDESVQGLEVGSPIKFRGVTVGTVGKIQVAPDHRHVQVESELGVEALTRLGLDSAPDPGIFDAPRRLEMASDLRLQLASSGLTGVKFLQLDFFDVASAPPPELPFPVPKNYIPTVPSMIKNLENSVSRMVGRLPEITDTTAAVLDQVGLIVKDAGRRELPARVVATLEAFDAFLATAHRKVSRFDADGLTASVTRTLAGLDAAVSNLDALVVRVGREDGVLASVERASHAIDDTLRDTDGLGGELVETLVSVRASARSLRRFTEALEVDPDMLVKGRGPGRAP